MVLVTRLTAHGRPVLQLGIAMVGFAGTVALLGVSGLFSSLPTAVVMVIGAGAGTLVAEVVAVTLLQRAAPPAVTARVFGVYDQLNVGRSRSVRCSPARWPTSSASPCRSSSSHWPACSPRCSR